jgi:hypothetical protein
MTSAQAYADRMMWGWNASRQWIWKAIKNIPSGLISHLRYMWVGFSMVFGAWKNWVMVADRTETIKYNKALAAKQGLMFDTRQQTDRDSHAAMRRKISAIVFILVALALFIVWIIWGSHPNFLTYTGLSVAGILVALDGIGHTYRDPEEEVPVRPVTPLEPGVSVRKLQASIQDILAAHKQPVDITFHGQQWYAHGLEFACHTSDKITDDHLRDLERHLQAGLGMITLITDRRNSAAPTLRLFWRDPLEGAVTPERRAPKSLSCKQPFSLTRRDDGSRGSYNVYGLHQFWVGESGSGKSSGLWTLIDWLVDCRDAKVFGIDLAGTVFSPYRRVMDAVASTADAAEELLDAATDEVERRVALLDAGLDADEDGLLDENWVASETPGEEAWFIILDEYKAIAQKYDAIREKVEHLMEVARKARIHIIISSPAADKSSLKTTTPVNQSMAKVIFSIPFSMITHVLGVGMTDDGWRPDRFEVGTPNDPADSGKVYIQAPDNPRPIVQRFDRLSPEDIRERNADRRKYKQEHTDPLPLPEGLQILKDAFEKAGFPEYLKTEEILPEGWTPHKLAGAVKKERIEPKLVGDKKSRGYEWLPVRAALRRYFHKV